MDYKEKYEQALERARQFSEKPYLEDSAGIVEYIFPELAESEDERIVKELLTFFRESMHGGHILTNKEYDSWIAWLEKQGQDGKVWFYRDNYVRDKKQTYQDGIDNVLNNPQKYGLEKQGEQKPVLCEEDIEMINYVASILNSNFNENDKFDDNKPCVGALVDRLKSLKDRVQPQPKQEWSEEDEEMKREIIEFLKSRAGFKQEWIDWLNKQSEKKESYIDMSLVDAVRFCVADNLAHKSTDDNGNTISFGVYIDNTIAKKLTNELFDIFQRSVEWSEEAEKKINNILNVLIDYKELESEYYWLKSLRPQKQWKPSDEQIKGIECAIKTLRHQLNVGDKRLNSLYDDLKKIREE